MASPGARGHFHEWFSARVNALDTDAVLMRLRNLASAVLFFAATCGLGTVALAVTAVEPTREFPVWGMLLVRVAAAFGMMLFLWLSWIQVAAGSEGPWPLGGRNDERPRRPHPLPGRSSKRFLRTSRSAARG